MGRREKEVSETSPTTAANSGKRVYNRKDNTHVDEVKAVNIAEFDKNIINLNQSESKLAHINNGLARSRKTVSRRSLATKRNSDEEDFVPEPSIASRPEVPSTINQRPRRQVKHKFIKSGNRQSITDELYTTLIGPISPSAPALIPVVERLSDKISTFADLMATKENKLTESIEIIQTIDGVPVMIEQSMPIEQTNLNANAKETRTKRTLGIPVRRRRGRQPRTLIDMAVVDTSQNDKTEINQMPFESTTLESTNQTVEPVHTIQDDSIVTIDETDSPLELNAFDGIENGAVDFAEEVVIEETVETSDFDHQTPFDVTCENSLAAEDSSNELVTTTEDVGDIIDVSDSLSFLNDDTDDDRSIPDVEMPSSLLSTHTDEKDVVLDMDENSLILVSPSSFEETITTVADEMTFDSHLADDDTANDGDVDEITSVPIDGSRRRSKRKSKSISLKDIPTNDSPASELVATTNDVQPSSPQIINLFSDDNISSVSAIQSPVPAQNFEENSTSEETTQSESNDQLSLGEVHAPRSRREKTERVNYFSATRRTYASRHTIKNAAESMSITVPADHIDDSKIGDIECEQPKSMIERVQTEPKFKFKKSEQLRTYERRSKAKQTNPDEHCSAPSTSSASDSTTTIASIAEVCVAADQITDAHQEMPNCERIGNDSTINGQIDQTPPKRRSAGRPKKSDVRRKQTKQTQLPTHDAIDENTATNVDASDEAIVKVDGDASAEQQQQQREVLLRTEMQQNVEIKIELDENREVPKDLTTSEVPIATTPEDDVILSKVENLAISSYEDVQVIEDANVATETPMDVDVADVPIGFDEQKPNVEVNMTTEEKDMPDASMAFVENVPEASEDRMEIESNHQIVVKEEVTSVPEIVPVGNEIAPSKSPSALECEAKVKLLKEENDETVAAESRADAFTFDLPSLKSVSVSANTRTSIEPSVDVPSMTLSVDSPIIPKELLDEMDDTTFIRRSGRIKTIKKSKQPSQGFGLVKEKKRYVDDDANNSIATGDNDQINEKDSQSQSNDGFTIRVARQKTQEELDKEQIDRENGLKLFAPIIDNEYRSERTISKEAKKMACDCFLTQSEIERGELGCGDDCLNRMLLIECGPRCNVNDRCTNKRFQRHQNADCTIFKTEKKGYGLIASSYIPAGVFIMEYVGEVLNSKQFEKRANDYSKLMNAHYYFMALSSDCVIDATRKGNISRFINHSCDPNAETQKWTVNGELRIGFFSSKAILPDEEITFDYQFQRYGREAQRCYCESVNCRGWIGGEPESDEEIYEDEEEEESDEESVVADGSDVAEGKADASIVKELKKTKAAAKPKKPKDATKKPVRKERTKVARKITTKRMKRVEIMDDPDLDKEIDELTLSGLKNQPHTLKLSRLMVRAKLRKAKSRLMDLLRDAELPCRRLFLDYRGLKLMHSWMCVDSASDVDNDRLQWLTFRLDILRTLEVLPVKNKTMLQDSKVLSTVQRWTNISEYICDKPNQNKPNDEISPCDSGAGTPISNDDVASPKPDEISTAAAPSTSAIATAALSSPNASAIQSAPATVCTLNTPAQTPPTTIKSTEVFDAIPQILEQSSALKSLGVDMLKRIISTNEKNTKIIEDSETNNKLPDGEMGKLIREIRLLASKLVTSWEQLPELFKIPKKLRIEQMKEHEREADQSYEKAVQTEKQTPTLQSTIPVAFNSRSFGDRSRERPEKSAFDSVSDLLKDKDPRHRRSYGNSTTLTKHQRRQMFEAKVAQENAERKKSLEQIVFENKCNFFKVDSRRLTHDMVPQCVNTTTGQWHDMKMKAIPTPPSHMHLKPVPHVYPADINEYHIPPIDLPEQWKPAINNRGQIYYYHTKIKMSQWEPPIRLLPLIEEQRVPEFDFRMDTIDRSLVVVEPNDDDVSKNDSDDDDEDVAGILSTMEMNGKRLLQLKSDPILEQNIDDDSSSTASEDSAQHDLEMQLSFLKEKTEACWENMKKIPNLNEEIAAMAKTDAGGSASPAIVNVSSSADQECEKINSSVPNDDKPKSKKRCRDKLVQEIRISPLSDEMKRELRRDSRRYKENKAKLRRQKESLLKRKSVSSTSDVPRKVKKITEGLPSIPKFDDDGSKEQTANHTPYVSTLSARLSELTARGNFPISSPSSSPAPSSASMTQSIVNKLPSIGHKFVSDTKELIAKNAMKPIKPVTVAVESNDAAIIKSSSSLGKHKKPTVMPARKSSPKPPAKKKKLNETSSELLDAHGSAAKKIKERFRVDISGDIVRHLRPYFSDTCEVGRIRSKEDFQHLARKLTFFVMLKELKYCNDVKVLEVTESVKVKAREYIKKYMAKFGEYYVRGENEQDYRFEDL